MNKHEFYIQNGKIVKIEDFIPEDRYIYCFYSHLSFKECQFKDLQYHLKPDDLKILQQESYQIYLDLKKGKKIQSLL